MKRFKISIVLAVCLVLVLCAFAPGVMAKQRAHYPRVIAANANPGGLSYGQWSELWWQWAFSVPASTSPLIDETGAWALTNQPAGDTWFLAGVGFTSATDVARTITIPHGKGLFMPLLNYEGSVADTPGYTLDQVEKMIVDFLDSADLARLTVDGRAMNLLSPAYRSGIYEGYYTLYSHDNLYESFMGLELPLNTPIGPTLFDGYDAYIPPLPVGEHVVIIEGGVPGWHFKVTYNITVVGD